MSAKRQQSVRAQFAAHGLDLRSVRDAAAEINRLIGLLRHEQNRRLALESHLANNHPVAPSRAPGTGDQP